MISTVVNQVRGRVPVVVNTGAQASVTAALYSRRAEELGASAVMCMPPSPVTGSETRSYFKAISDAINVPIFIQDTLTTPVSAAVIRQMAEESRSTCATRRSRARRSRRRLPGGGGGERRTW